jgi:hypothetical protein
MNTHYSAAELSKLIEAANTVCERNDNKPELVVLRHLNVFDVPQTHAKFTQDDLVADQHIFKYLKRLVARGGIELAAYLYDKQGLCFPNP